MAAGLNIAPLRLERIVHSSGSKPLFSAGDRVRIDTRNPVGHYRVPIYLRGLEATVEAVIEPANLDNEQEAYGRNAGGKLHYYRLSIPMNAIWPKYSGSRTDALRIEVYETWLERV